jgi:hypothetical protein
MERDVHDELIDRARNLGVGDFVAVRVEGRLQIRRVSALFGAGFTVEPSDPAAPLYRWDERDTTWTNETLPLRPRERRAYRSP